MADKVSPFLHPGPASTADKLSIIHLRRDLQVPTILKEHDEDDEGYSEGKVVNTRFGSFPHSTLIGLPWGSQVRASKVDTGSRGRRGKVEDKKRKRGEPVGAASKKPRLQEDAADTGTNEEHKGKQEDPEAEENKKPRLEEEVLDAGEVSTSATTKGETEAVAATSGFVHLLPPTPENWTSSLPHRTQVVYTPDYSYILHRLRARPGTNIIEAGAGSGSFTHASARAVYNGYPEQDDANSPPTKRRKLGKVWSFEFHQQRHEKLQQEIAEHCLEGIVQITHRDVCEDGFLVNGASPDAEAIFLDLPAPWVALRHLTRSKPPPTPRRSNSPESLNGTTNGDPKPFISPLNPSAPVQICTFSPCIEQVQRTVSAMRQLGWVDITMVEVSQKRFEVLRQRIGIDNGAQRGLQTTPASVEEALRRLIDVEGTFKSFHESGGKPVGKKRDKENPNNRDKIIESLVDKKVYKEGRLVHKTEQEIKTHTSYLVFATLPQEWTDEDERKVREEWPVKIRKEGEGGDGEVVGVSRRQKMKAEKQAKRDQEAAAKEDQAATAEGTKEDGERESCVEAEKATATEDAAAEQL